MQSNVSAHGMAVAPHHLASQSAVAVLRRLGQGRRIQKAQSMFDGLCAFCLLWRFCSSPVSVASAQWHGTLAP